MPIQELSSPMRSLIRTAAITGFLSVAMGAFGAHALGDQLTLEAQGWWETATLYALVHSAAALSTGLHNSKYTRAGWLFLIGILIFSGSLYAMALGAPRWFGAITPVGGLSFLTGWGMVALKATQRKHG